MSDNIVERAENQHKELAHIMKLLRAAISTEDTVQILPLFRELSDKLIEHMHVEECLFDILTPTQSTTHHQAHLEFIDAVNALHDDIKSHCSKLKLLEALIILKQYITRHQAVEDQILFQAYRDYKAI